MGCATSKHSDTPVATLPQKPIGLDKKLDIQQGSVPVPFAGIDRVDTWENSGAAVEDTSISGEKSREGNFRIKSEGQ